MVSLDEHEIGDDAQGSTVTQAFAAMATSCAQTHEAEPLFRQLLARLQAARDELQKRYENNAGGEDQRALLKAFEEAMAAFADELERYSNSTLVNRVLQHKKVVQKLREMHGASGSQGGLDQLFELLQADESTMTEWKWHFEKAAMAFEMAVANKLVDDVVLNEYKKNPSLALEAVTLLRNADKNGDAFEWQHNPSAQYLLSQLERVHDWDVVTLPDWFIAESEISYKKKRFAHGSYGAVHYGTWGLGTNVVVKLVRADARNERLNETLRNTFIDEANLWFKLSHPYVLKLYGACHVTAPPFFVCEEAQQGNLSMVLARGKSRMWRLLFQSALAIEYLHRKNVVHGDLKLNNVLVGADGNARVADFGLSRVKKQSRNKMLTRHDSVLEGAGALRWRAPEALEHKAQIASDVYSFAMCIIEAVGGRIPYENVDDDDEVMDKIRSGELPERPEEMSDEIWELVQKMTTRAPDQRATMQDAIPVLKKLAAAEFDKECDAHGIDNSSEQMHRLVLTAIKSNERAPVPAGLVGNHVDGASHDQVCGTTTRVPTPPSWTPPLTSTPEQTTQTQTQTPPVAKYKPVGCMTFDQNPNGSVTAIMENDSDVDEAARFASSNTKKYFFFRGDRLVVAFNAQLEEPTVATDCDGVARGLYLWKIV